MNFIKNNLKKMTTKKITLTVLSIISLVLIDQFTKYLIDANMNLYQSIDVIKGFFKIFYVTNTGAAFSFLSGNEIFFLIIVPIAIIFLFVFLFKTENKFEFIAVIFIIAGAFGNYLDRLIRGFVVDFLSFNIFGYEFAVFNVADIYLSLAVTALIVYYLFKDVKAK